MFGKFSFKFDLAWLFEILLFKLEVSLISSRLARVLETDFMSSSSSPSIVVRNFGARF